MSLSDTSSLRSRAAAAVLIVAVAAYIAFFSWLSIAGHQAFQTNAMDLGYTSQAVWNTRHGRILEFSTYENAQIDLPLDAFARTDHLLGYHVELLLVPIALLYVIHDGPVTLLVLQSIVLGLGALPAFWLARRRLRSDLAALVFALAFLLAPAIQGANLSDFHAVSLTATILLFAFHFLESKRHGLFLAALLLAMSAKEDIPLLAFMLGLYLIVWRRQRRLGLLVAALGAGWFIVCTRLIMPYYSGLSVSPFFQRLAIWGDTPVDSWLHALTNPQLIIDWLAKPDIIAYLGGLLASGGFMSLFNPILLLVSAPVLVVNTFSAWDWTYSEGAHYSASLIPFVIVSAINGLGWLAAAAARRLRRPPERLIPLLSLLVLAISVAHHYQVGVSPLTPNFHPPQPTAHQRLTQQMLAAIPPAAAVSTQTGLYPHLSQRRKAYLFPAINDAEYILVDVTASAYPSSMDEVAQAIRTLLVSAEFRVLAAQDGLILLKREPVGDLVLRLPASFYSFVRAEQAAVRYPLSVRFGDTLELVGYDYRLFTVVHARTLPAQIVTYWRLLSPPDHGYAPVFFFTRGDGAIVGHYGGPTAAGQWHPVGRWRAGEIVRIALPILPVGRLHDVLLSVTSTPNEPWRSDTRLQPAPDEHAGLVGDGSLLKLFSFR